MLEKIQSTLKDPKVQRQAAQVVGNVVGFIAITVTARLISNGIEVGINKIMDKVSPLPVENETPASE